MKKNITIVGCGTMGKAIATILAKDPTIKIFTIDKDYGDTSGISKSDFIILAVKPKDASDAIQKLNDYGINKKTILISIMAGVAIEKLLKLSSHKKIIRMMPNLGLSVGVGIAVWKKVGLSSAETKKATNLINKITENFETKDEDTIDKVTAISGSGPAYFFLLADYLIKGAQNLGLSKKESEILVRKTFLASAMFGKDSDYPSLIEKIASKKGTTEAALKVFKNKNFGKIISAAVDAAYKRAKQISHE